MRILIREWDSHEIREISFDQTRSHEILMRILWEFSYWWWFSTVQPPDLITRHGQINYKRALFQEKRLLVEHANPLECMQVGKNLLVPRFRRLKGFEQIWSNKATGWGQYAISNSPQWYFTKGKAITLDSAEIKIVRSMGEFSHWVFSYYDRTTSSNSGSYSDFVLRHHSIRNHQQFRVENPEEIPDLLRRLRHVGYQMVIYTLSSTQQPVWYVKMTQMTQDLLKNIVSKNSTTVGVTIW